MVALLNFKRVARALQVIISVSRISFFAYFFYLCSSCESVHEFLLALLASDFSAVDCFVDKKMVFLLCIGIILCVSALPGSGSYSAHNLQEDGFGLKPAVKPSFEEKAGRESTGSTTESSLKNMVADLEMNQDQIEEHEEHDEEEEEEEESMAVSEEESDERFEDFIRKMREQIGIVSLSTPDAIVPANYIM